METRFLDNRNLWHEIQSRIVASKSCQMAVAYFGMGAAKLLPLQRGHRLVVDMSLASVRQGVTDPREVKKLIRRGVEVFSRGSLHAKFVICDQWLIAGSANGSSNSFKNLDEAGIVTNDAASIAEARKFHQRLCTEPVRERYLELCIREYRPPKFKAAVEPKHAGNSSKEDARVWFIGGLAVVEPKGQDAESLEVVEAEASKKFQNASDSVATWIRYREKPQFVNRLRTGDWIVRSLAERNGQKFIHPPSQVVGQEEWISARGTNYHLVLLESPAKGQQMSWTAFQKRVKTFMPQFVNGRAMTRGLSDADDADNLLRLWTSRGRIAKDKS